MDIDINIVPILNDLNKGDKKAFTYVFNRYYRLLYTVAFRYLKSEDSAMDAVQETFMRLWEKKDTLTFDTTPTVNSTNPVISGGIKTYVDSAVSSVYKYKGSIATYEDLPTTDLTTGDVYNVEDTGDNYAWNGTAWDKLAGTVDLSGYYTSSQTDSAISNAINNAITITLGGSY